MTGAKHVLWAHRFAEVYGSFASHSGGLDENFGSKIVWHHKKLMFP